jgi:hypothetical protein
MEKLLFFLDTLLFNLEVLLTMWLYLGVLEEKKFITNASQFGIAHDLYNPRFVLKFANLKQMLCATKKSNLNYNV